MVIKFSPPARFSLAHQTERLQQLAAARVMHERKKALTAAGLIVDKEIRVTPTYSSWQNEAWGFYESLGELRYVIDWKANLISRVRLRAAKRESNYDEPVIQDKGIAVEIINDLKGLTGDQTQLMKQMAVHINVPGECWLVGETINGKQQWRVCSSEEIRSKGSNRHKQEFDIISETSSVGHVTWRPLSKDSIITRIWQPNKRLHYMADTPVRAAMNTMRELELVSRHMQSQYLSRLASAGVLLIPDEITFPVRPEFMDAPDPFVREWIETAAEAIKTPGTAAGVIPIPMRVPSEYIENFRFLDFTLVLDRDIVAKYDKLVRRFATQLDAPPEILLGTGDTNHWSAWAIEESAAKAHILPNVELITTALTTGYLHPQLEVMGEDYTDWVVWYDASEILLRPDRSTAAKEVHDRFALSNEALRRESGFSEDDAPDDEEVEQHVLTVLSSRNLDAYYRLVGESDVQPMKDSNVSDGQDQQDKEGVDVKRHIGSPEKDDDKDTDDGDTLSPEESKQYRIQQLNTKHALRINLNDYELLHPQICMNNLASCPFTYAVYFNLPPALPGIAGTYECRLDRDGELRIGGRLLIGTADMIEATLRRKNDGRRITVL